MVIYFLTMRVAGNMDGTYSLIEVAPVVGVPESTLFRYRWQGKLFTTYDFTVDEELKKRIMTFAPRFRTRIIGRSAGCAVRS